MIIVDTSWVWHVHSFFNLLGLIIGSWFNVFFVSNSEFVAISLPNVIEKLSITGVVNN